MVLSAMFKYPISLDTNWEEKLISEIDIVF